MDTNEACCGNCGKLWDRDKLKRIEDFWQRVDAGDEVPAGECPECGALCFLEKPARGRTSRRA